MDTQGRDAGAAADEERYAAVLRRDATQDGRFLYGVRTTGVYCRPGCAARPPRRGNVSFHPSCEAAEQAGFRPCRRCRPDEPPRPERHAELVRQACHLIDAAEQAPTLAVLARQTGLSPFHFHRIFRQVAGVTPRAYADARRAARLQQALGASAHVTAAIYDAGYNAASRCYEAAPARLGMTPGAYRRGGADALIHFAVGQCSLGAILVATTARGICAIALADDADGLVRELQDRFPRAELVGGDARFERLVAQVVGFVEAPARGLDLPLDMRGTAFQQRVWQALRAIPAGSTASYADVAAGIGAPAAIRAVARACAGNTLAVAIPCHRVVRLDGALSGYRWGVERKRALLENEREQALPECEIADADAPRHPASDAAAAGDQAR